VRDAPVSTTPADRTTNPLAGVLDDPVRSAMLAALTGGRALPAGELARRAGLQPGALPAAITSEFLERGWLSRVPGRRLRVADGFDDTIEEWLAT
jgi:hypothetical protein